MAMRTKDQNAQRVRAAIYVRVSSEEQVEGYSLPAQERAAEAYCQSHGWDIVAVYRDEGRSARTDNIAKRPDFARMLADAEAKRFDVILVHKLDRLSRNRGIAFETFDRLGKAGVGFVSIAENMDYSTPAGQLMLTMLVGLGQFYSDNLSFETKKGKSERKAQGKHNGLLPFGVTVNDEDVPILDLATHNREGSTDTMVISGRGLELAFELAAAGKSDREVAQALTHAGYRTSGNRGKNPFTKDTVRHILQNRFYLGELPDRQGGWMPGKHGALIDPKLFEKAESARAANARQPRGGRMSRPRRTAGGGTPWALSGLAVCSCGASIVANSRSNGRRSLRCYGRIQGNGCDEPSFPEDLIDEQFTAILRRFDVPHAEQERMLAAWRRHQGGAIDTTAARTRLRQKAHRLKDLYLDGELDRAEYHTRKPALDDELAALPEDGNASSDVGNRLMSFLGDVAEAWKLATPEERNKLARQLFAEAIVENKTVVAVKPRPDLLPFFQGVNWCLGGSDGNRSRMVEIFAPRKIRIPAIRIHNDHEYVTPSQRYMQRPRKLTPAEECSVRSLAHTKSLRSLAADFGISHETVRSIVPEREASE